MTKAQSIYTESRIIDSFSRHAKSYDRHAHLQKTMAERLASLLPDVLPDRVLEIGCGTGVFTRHLLAHPIRWLVLNDIAPAMTDLLRERVTLPPSARIVHGNAGRMDFESAGLIAANAVFQWFPHPGDTLCHLARFLAPGGRLIFSTFGPGTLQEFRETAQLQSPATLLSRKQWSRLIRGAGLTPRESIAETRKTFSPSTLALIKNLQQIGAAPFQMIKPGGLRKLIREYDANFSTRQGIYATWELLYFSASHE
ncbi:MAG: methyltransferase domain-containing protein [Nitrospinaceae bacterium]